ncbi:MAG: type II toxin-antitoxin system RelE/ParE family toxin [Nitrosomonadales bacterium]|nr:type II toxin-antitoxin system RelE/ParE family toxin [Nitrosomonadales bacterium]
MVLRTETHTAIPIPLPRRDICVPEHSADTPRRIRKDIEAALALLVEEPGIGTKVETKRPDIVRRLYLTRVQYFVYYRVRGKFLDVIAFWHSRRETGSSL